MLWKSLLDYGRSDLASSLARGVIAAYIAAARRSDGCPEWIDGRTGEARGALDFSGDACALIPLYRAYHMPGAVSVGWDTQLLDVRYTAAQDSLRVICKTHARGKKEAMLCVVARHNSRYTVDGSIKCDASSDADGVLTLTGLPDGVTLELTIAPAPGQNGGAR
jgi:hypothetical protein